MLETIENEDFSGVNQGLEDRILKHGAFSALTSGVPMVFFMRKSGIRPVWMPLVVIPGMFVFAV